MKRIIIGIIVVLAFATPLAGCGKLEQVEAHLSGKGSEVCQDGVVYLQFTSGTTVKYTRDGKIATCN